MVVRGGREKRGCNGDSERVKFCTPKALEYLDEDTEARMRHSVAAPDLSGGGERYWGNSCLSDWASSPTI